MGLSPSLYSAAGGLGKLATGALTAHGALVVFNGFGDTSDKTCTFSLGNLVGDGKCIDSFAVLAREIIVI